MTDRDEKIRLKKSRRADRLVQRRWALIAAIISTINIPNGIFNALRQPILDAYVIGMILGVFLIPVFLYILAFKKKKGQKPPLKKPPYHEESPNSFNMRYHRNRFRITGIVVRQPTNQMRSALAHKLFLAQYGLLCPLSPGNANGKTPQKRPTAEKALPPEIQEAG